MCAVFVSSAAVDPDRDFGGLWKLNAARSDLSALPTAPINSLRIEQDEAAIRFKSQDLSRAASWSYSPAGKTTRFTLDGAARASDPSGSVAADLIRMNQMSGDYTAEGRVTTTRQPDRKGKSSAMLSTQELLHATARRMISTGGNQKIQYEGDAKAWQGANR